MLKLALAIALLVLGQTVSSQEHWPSFRGPAAGVVPDNPKLPERWSTTENVAWKIDMPGRGWSSPIVWGNTIFVTTTLGDEGPVQRGYAQGANYSKPAGGFTWVLYAIDFASGRVKWQRTLHEGLPPEARHIKNTHSSETPVTDGQRVYVYIGSVSRLFAVDFNGNVVWASSTVPPDPKPPAEAGTAASPALHKGRVYVVDDHDDRRWMLVSFDARTGKELWRVIHPKERQTHGWATPFVWENRLRTEIVVAGGRIARSYDVNGTLLWELHGLTNSTTPTPFAAHDLLFLQSGYPGEGRRPTFAIQPGARGNISLKEDESTNDSIVWSNPRMASYLNSSLVYGGHYYTLITNGFLTCHDAKTGAQLYDRQRIDIDSNGFAASPWAYNGKVFLLSEDGDTYVIQAGPEYKLLWKNSLNELAMATPAIARDSIIIRTMGHLYRFATRTAPASAR